MDKQSLLEDAGFSSMTTDLQSPERWSRDNGCYADVVRIYPDGHCAISQHCDEKDLPALLNYRQTAEALRWLVNLACGVGKAGGAPEPGELEEAVEAGKTVLAALSPKEGT